MKTYTFTTSNDFRRIQLIEEQLKANAGTIRVTFAAYDRRDAFKHSKNYQGVYTMRFNDDSILLFDVMRSTLRQDVWNALLNNKNVLVDVVSL